MYESFRFTWVSKIHIYPYKAVFTQITQIAFLFCKYMTLVL